MDENRMRDKVQKAVAQRCEGLTPDPFLAARVMRLAEGKGEEKMKKKLSVGLALCIVLALLSLTALAAAILGVRELVENNAIPLAQGNDGEVRTNDTYSYEELVAIVQLAAENGISLEDDSHIMEALARGEGYWEEETIMAICREAFGGLIYEWTPEERYWFGEKMVEIGFRAENNYQLPGENMLSTEEAVTEGIRILREKYGADLPLDDESLYRCVVEFGEFDWSINFHARSLDLPSCWVSIPHGEGAVETTMGVPFPENATETELMSEVNRVFGYRTYSQSRWGLQGWYEFGQRLPKAQRSEAWTAEYDGYLATTYLLPTENDLTAEEAKAIALQDAGVTFPIFRELLLLGDGDRRIWKVNLRVLNDAGETVTRSWEIDAATGEILHCMTIDSTIVGWAKYMLHTTYEAVSASSMTAEDAKNIAIAALREEFGNEAIPYDDPTFFDVSINGSNSGDVFACIFTPKTLNFGKCNVHVKADGQFSIQYGDADPLSADNLNKRFDHLYGSSLRWDQSTWVAFDEMLDTLPEPTTFEGRLYAATHYPEASSVKVTLDEALDIVYLSLEKDVRDAISWVLIDAEPHPVWKIRHSYRYDQYLFEVDAMTGEITDREFYVCQNPEFDHDMKMFTTRKTYMPAALQEFGPVRIAMELTVKAYHEDFSYDETVFMNPACYEITEDGMTVTFKSIDEYLPSYRTTILDGGMDAEIEVFDIPDPELLQEGPVGGNG